MHYKDENGQPQGRPFFVREEFDSNQRIWKDSRLSRTFAFKLWLFAPR